VEGLGLLVSLDPRRLGERWAGSSLPEERVEGCVAVRVDGVGFSSRLAGLASCGKPRCASLHFAEVAAAVATCRRYGCVAAYVVSDEATFFFRPGCAAYGGRVYKLVSVLASEFSSMVSLSLGAPLPYDARVVVVDDAVEYIAWRMRVAFGNYVSQLYHSRPGTRRGQTPRLGEMLAVVGDQVLGEDDWRVTGSLAAAVTVRVGAVDRRTGARVEVTRRRWVAVSGACRILDLAGRLAAEGILCGSQKYSCGRQPSS